MESYEEARKKEILVQSHISHWAWGNGGKLKPLEDYTKHDVFDWLTARTGGTALIYGHPIVNEKHHIARIAKILFLHGTTGEALCNIKKYYSTYQREVEIDGNNIGPLSEEDWAYFRAWLFDAKLHLTANIAFLNNIIDNGKVL